MQRVYRGERAQRGRFREFYQCDIDIIGREKLGTLAEGVQAIGVLAQFRKADAQDRRTAVIPVAELGKKVLEFRNFSVQVAAP